MKAHFGKSWFLLGIGLIAWGLSRPAAAKDSPQGPDPQEYQHRSEGAEQKQKVLERNQPLKETAEMENAKDRPAVKVGAGGISIGSADGNNEIRFRGLVQGDARFYLDRDGQGAGNTFVARRVRPWIEGKFAKRWEFRIMPDFGQGKVVLQDAWINTVIFPEFKIQLGKIKTPVGLERLESASDIHFVERAFPTALVPNRDFGIVLNGDILEGVFQYQVGVFNGVPDGASADFDLNDSTDFVGRVFAHPFRRTSEEAAKRLGVGISGTFGHPSGNEKEPQLASYKSAGQQTFFKFLNDGTAAGTAVASGSRWRLSPQAYWYYKGLGILGEYVVSSQKVALAGASASIKNQAWQVAATYVVGADNSFGKIKPQKPLGWTHGGTGAFEFGARYNELKIDPDAFPSFADPAKSARKAKAWGATFNWIINDNAKFMLDFEQTRFNGGDKAGNRKTESVILNRYQLAF